MYLFKRNPTMSKIYSSFYTAALSTLVLDFPRYNAKRCNLSTLHASSEQLTVLKLKAQANLKAEYLCYRKTGCDQAITCTKEINPGNCSSCPGRLHPTAGRTTAPPLKRFCCAFGLHNFMSMQGNKPYIYTHKNACLFFCAKGKCEIYTAEDIPVSRSDLQSRLTAAICISKYGGSGPVPKP